MSDILWLACLAFFVVLLLETIAASILVVSGKIPAVLKIFRVMDYTTTVTGFVVVFLWIASLVFGI